MKKKMIGAVAAVLILSGGIYFGGSMFQRQLGSSADALSGTTVPTSAEGIPVMAPPIAERFGAPLREVVQAEAKPSLKSFAASERDVAAPPPPASKPSPAHLRAPRPVAFAAGGAVRGGVPRYHRMAKMAVVRSRSAGFVGRVAAAPMPRLAEKADAQVASGNRFTHHDAHGFVDASVDRDSTFAADVDTASYTLARRYLQMGRLPAKDSVRVEEWVNAFDYDYAPPRQGAFNVHFEGAPSPFTPHRWFLRVGVKGKVISRKDRKPLHLVFLVDDSGSMAEPDKLGLAKQSLKLLVENLDARDTVSLVTYAGGVKDVLPPTPGNERARIDAAIASLQPGGGTAMGSGMEIAYQHALAGISSKAVSRVVVLTDGDANIGRTSPRAILASIHKYVNEGVRLSTIGFGMGNYRDDMLEKLADEGNGNSFYVDSLKAAQRIFEKEFVGTMQIIAKDVKIQVDFDPDSVRRYRLIGYEDRAIRDQDFRNDAVDAGEIGAGHTVTALYEVDLTGAPSDHLATVRIRAKKPNGSVAAEQHFTFARSQMDRSMASASTDLRFQTAVASAADILRGAAASENWSLAESLKLAKGATEARPARVEFVHLLERAVALHRSASSVASATHYGRR